MAAHQVDIPYLWVHNPQSPKSEGGDVMPADLRNIWNEICAKGLPTLSDMEKLAVEFNILSGRWLMFVSKKKVDYVWGRIVELTLAGALGDRAKVSTHCPAANKHKHIICIYNSDYRCEAEVTRLRTEIWRLGVKRHISYKPDIFSLLGIRKFNNLVRLRAQLFFSK